MSSLSYDKGENAALNIIQGLMSSDLSAQLFISEVMLKIVLSNTEVRQKIREIATAS